MNEPETLKLQKKQQHTHEYMKKKFLSLSLGAGSVSTYAQTTVISPVFQCASQFNNHLYMSALL